MGTYVNLNLWQVLGSVKQQVEAYAQNADNFKPMLVRARRYLLHRDKIYFGEHQEEPLKQEKKGEENFYKVNK